MPVSKLDECYEGFYKKLPSNIYNDEETGDVVPIAIDDEFKTYAWQYLAMFPGLIFLETKSTADSSAENTTKTTQKTPKKPKKKTVSVVSAPEEPSLDKSMLAQLGWAEVNKKYPQMYVKATREYMYRSIFGTPEGIARVLESKTMWQVLQKIAKTREEGIPQVTLTKEMSLDPRGIFHYIRVMEKFGILTKYAYCYKGANTNLIVMSRFVKTLKSTDATVANIKRRPRPSVLEDQDQDIPGNTNMDNGGSTEGYSPMVGSGGGTKLARRFELKRLKLLTRNRLIRAMLKASNNIMVEPDAMEASGLNIENSSDLYFFRKIVLSLENINVMRRLRVRLLKEAEGGVDKSIRVCLQLNKEQMESRFGKPGDDIDQYLKDKENIEDQLVELKKMLEEDEEDDDDDDIDDEVPKPESKEDIRHIMSIPNTQKGQIPTLTLQTQIFRLLALAGNTGVTGKVIQFLVSERRYKMVSRMIGSLVQCKDEDGQIITTMTETVGRERRLRYFLREDCFNWLTPWSDGNDEEYDITGSAKGFEPEDQETDKDQSKEKAGKPAENEKDMASSDKDNTKEPIFDQEIFQLLYDANNGKLSVNITLVQYVVLKYLNERKIIDSTVEFQHEVATEVMRLYSLLKQDPSLTPVVYRRQPTGSPDIQPVLGSPIRSPLLSATMASPPGDQDIPQVPSLSSTTSPVAIPNTPVAKKQKISHPDPTPATPSTPINKKKKGKTPTIALFSPAVVEKATTYRLDKRTIMRAMDSLAKMGLAHCRKAETEFTFDTILDKEQKALDKPIGRNGEEIDDSISDKYTYYRSKRIILVHLSIDPESEMVNLYISGLQDRALVTKAYAPVVSCIANGQIERLEGAEERDRKAAEAEHNMYAQITHRKDANQRRRDERLRKRLKLGNSPNTDVLNLKKIGYDRHLIYRSSNADLGYINARMIRVRLFHQFILCLVRDPSIDPARIFSHNRFKSSVLFRQIPLRMLLQFITWGACPPEIFEYVNKARQNEAEMRQNKAVKGGDSGGNGNDNSGGSGESTTDKEVPTSPSNSITHPKPKESLSTAIVDLPDEVRVAIMKKIRRIRVEFLTCLNALMALGLVKPLKTEVNIMTQDDPPSPGIPIEDPYLPQAITHKATNSAVSLILERRNLAQFHDRLELGYQVMEKVYMRDYSQNVLSPPKLAEPLRHLRTKDDFDSFWGELKLSSLLGSQNKLNEEATLENLASSSLLHGSGSANKPEKSQKLDLNHPLYYLRFIPSWQITLQPTVRQRNIVESYIDVEARYTPSNSKELLEKISAETGLNVEYLRSYYKKRERGLLDDASRKRRNQRSVQRRRERRRKNSKMLYLSPGGTIVKGKPKGKNVGSDAESDYDDDDDDDTSADLINPSALNKGEGNIEAAVRDQRKRRRRGIGEGERAGRLRKQQTDSILQNANQTNLDPNSGTTEDDVEGDNDNSAIRVDDIDTQTINHQTSSSFVAMKSRWSTEESNKLLHVYVILKHKFNTSESQLTWVPATKVFPHRTQVGKRATEKLRRNWERLIKSPTNINYMTKLYFLWRVLYNEGVSEGAFPPNDKLSKFHWDIMPELTYFMEATQNEDLDVLLEKHNVHVPNFTQGLISRMPFNNKRSLSGDGTGNSIEDYDEEEDDDGRMVIGRTNMKGLSYQLNNILSPSQFKVGSSNHTQLVATLGGIGSSQSQYVLSAYDLPSTVDDIYKLFYVKLANQADIRPLVSKYRSELFEDVFETIVSVRKSHLTALNFQLTSRVGWTRCLDIGPNDLLASPLLDLDKTVGIFECTNSCDSWWAKLLEEEEDKKSKAMAAITPVKKRRGRKRKADQLSPKLSPVKETSSTTGGEATLRAIDIRNALAKLMYNSIEMHLHITDRMQGLTPFSRYTYSQFGFNAGNISSLLSPSHVDLNEILKPTSGVNLDDPTYFELRGLINFYNTVKTDSMTFESLTLENNSSGFTKNTSTTTNDGDTPSPGKNTIKLLQKNYITQGIIQCLIVSILLTPEGSYSSVYSYAILNNNSRWSSESASQALERLKNSHIAINIRKAGPLSAVEAASISAVAKSGIIFRHDNPLSSVRYKSQSLTHIGAGGDLNPDDTITTFKENTDVTFGNGKGGSENNQQTTTTTSSSREFRLGDDLELYKDDYSLGTKRKLQPSKAGSATKNDNRSDDDDDDDALLQAAVKHNPKGYKQRDIRYQYTSKVPGRGFSVSEKFLAAMKGAFPTNFIAEAHIARRRWYKAGMVKAVSNVNGDNINDLDVENDKSNTVKYFKFNQLLTPGEMAYLVEELAMNHVVMYPKYPYVVNAQKVSNNSFKLADTRQFDFDFMFFTTFAHSIIPPTIFYPSIPINGSGDGSSRRLQEYRKPLYDIAPSGTKRLMIMMSKSGNPKEATNSDGSDDSSSMMVEETDENNQTKEGSEKQKLADLVVDLIKAEGVFGLDIIGLKTRLYQYITALKSSSPNKVQDVAKILSDKVLFDVVQDLVISGVPPPAPSSQNQAERSGADNDHYANNAISRRIYQVGFTDIRFVAAEFYSEWIVNRRPNNDNNQSDKVNKWVSNVTNPPATTTTTTTTTSESPNPNPHHQDIKIVTPSQFDIDGNWVSPPRIWFNIYGDFNQPVWRGCMQSIASWVAKYPGIYESRLAQKMIYVVTRAELRELLDEMVKLGILKRKCIVDPAIRIQITKTSSRNTKPGLFSNLRRSNGSSGGGSNRGLPGFSYKTCQDDMIIREDKISCYWVTYDYLGKI
ncbi:hypothetical protein H4219_003542 [Mycoemilia scoparia]|uniref:B-block binding subunit of TFIIIC domain-containing protein n=1 Tax=Mycoemilia scoparia TaxID=417184 RepID=A0A9W8DMP2_9FUNG|nr:hypothetical protein H4219_003542 [Mycoemilia scoparia]